jgi:hypothetical protein
MTEPEIQPAAQPVPGLTQWQRITNTFAAPSKTFEDIKRGNRSWWLPFILFVVIGTGLWVTVTSKVSWEQVRDNNFRIAPKSAERLDSLPADQKEQQLKYATIGQKWTWAFAPVGILIMDLIAAGVLLGTINFGFGGKATFGKVLAVIWYGGLPGLIKLLIGIAGLYAGVTAESFLPGNPAGTNLGYYLDPVDTNKALYYLAVSLDPITIWSLVLTSIGLAIVAGTKRSAGYAAVFGWWIVTILISVGVSAAFS